MDSKGPPQLPPRASAPPPLPPREPSYAPPPYFEQPQSPVRSPKLSPEKTGPITMNESVSPEIPPRSRSTSPSAFSDGSNDGRPRKDTIHLTPYTTHVRRLSNHPYNQGTTTAHEGDPRSDSLQSLLPAESAAGTRRTLLVVYIHGFVGNDTSFQSFPAHVHNLLAQFLAETHVVHSKIYPRYKSRKNISYARDDFSNWLYPHESPSTDVVLVGHSLGGILAAEVVLLPSHVPTSKKLFQHRILGIIAIDTPFLGMHPSVVGTGIASLFRSDQSKTPDITKTPTNVSEAPSTTTLIPSPGHSSTDNPLSPSMSITSDPFTLAADANFNPAFPNDIVLPQRGKLENFWYFWNKHSGEVGKAVSSYVTSHLEFGGCLADYPGLHQRYSAVRNLEDIDDAKQAKDAQGRKVPRVRFVNYYSASTGRIKERLKPSALTSPVPGVGSDADLTRTASRSSRRGFSRSPSTRSRRSARSLKPAEEPWEQELSAKDGDTPPDVEALLAHPHKPNHLIEQSGSSDGEMAHLDPVHIESDAERAPPEEKPVLEDWPTIPPIPEPPVKPEEKDYTLTEFFKASLTVYARELKKYNDDKKAHDKAVKTRQKMLKAEEKATAKATSKEAKERARLEKQKIKAEQKMLKEEKKAKEVEEKHQLKRQATLNQETYDNALEQEAVEQGVSKDKVQNKKRDRKFCALPGKGREGERDQTWVRVYMEGVDEIAAHTGMFVMSETYAKLVGDAAERIQSWVVEAGLVGREMERSDVVGGLGKV